MSTHRLKLAFDREEAPLDGRAIAIQRDGLDYPDNVIAVKVLDAIWRASKSMGVTVTMGDVSKMLSEIEAGKTVDGIDVPPDREFRDLISAGMIEGRIATKSIDQTSEAERWDELQRQSRLRPPVEFGVAPSGAYIDLADQRAEAARTDALMRSRANIEADRAAEAEAIARQRAAEQAAADEALRRELPAQFGGYQR